MPANGLSTGIDIKLTFADANGAQNFQTIETFTEAEMATTNEHVSIGGVTYFPKLHMGWTGTFSFIRISDALDLYIARQEAGYYLGVDQFPATITKTVREANGQLSQYSYTNCVITLTDGGKWSGTDIVTQVATWKGSRKQVLA